MKRFELSFDIVYLTTIFAASAVSLCIGRGRPAGLLFAAMAFVLGVGDLLHLAPRIRVLRGGSASARARGLGTLATSVTATLYYLLLCQAWAACYTVAQHFAWLPIAAGVAAVRVVLCLLPQNRWTSGGAGPGWSLLRNVPFVALGAVTVGLFLLGNRYDPVPALRFVPLALALSFAFYLPVALFGRRVPALGALMMPKTLCYLWVQAMGIRFLLG